MATNRGYGDALRIWLIIAIAISPCLYVLSIGPAYGLHHRHALSYETYFTAYWPIRQACRIKAVDRIVYAYVSLWQPPFSPMTLPTDLAVEAAPENAQNPTEN